MSFKFESNEAESYVAGFVFLFLTVVPATLWRLRRKSATVPSTCGCRLCKEKAAKKTTYSLSFGQSVLIVGWLLLAFCAFKIATSETTTILFDPWEILGIHESATKAEIRAAYRRLSLIEHPDRSTRDDAEARFIQISRAYKILTDEKARENFFRYGDPDGPKENRFGIALPSLFSDPTFVILVYSVLLAFIPAFVYWWLTKSNKRLGNGVSKGLVQQLIKLWDNEKSVKSPEKVLDLVAAVLPKDPILSSERLLGAIADSPFGKNNINGTTKPTTLALVAHMSRANISIPTAFLQRSFAVVDIAMAVAAKRGQWPDMLSCITLSRGLAMAIPPSLLSQNEQQQGVQLLQLPGITIDQAHALARQKILSIADFASAPREMLASVVTDEATLADASCTANAFPILGIESATFVDASNPSIPPHTDSDSISCLITVSISTIGGRAQYSQTTAIDTLNTASKNLSRSAMKKAARKAANSAHNARAEPTDSSDNNIDKSTGSNAYPPQYVCAPYAPGPLKAGFWIFIVNDSTQEILNGEFVTYNNTAISEIAIPLPTPSSPSIYAFSIHALDSCRCVTACLKTKMRIEKFTKKQKIALGIGMNAME